MKTRTKVIAEEIQAESQTHDATVKGIYLSEEYVSIPIKQLAIQSIVTIILN